MAQNKSSFATNNNNCTKTIDIFEGTLGDFTFEPKLTHNMQFTEQSQK